MSTEFAEEGMWPTPQQWVNRFLSLGAAERLRWAHGAIGDAQEASRCFEEDHDSHITRLHADPDEALAALARVRALAYGYERSMPALVADLRDALEGPVGLE